MHVYKDKEFLLINKRKDCFYFLPVLKNGIFGRAMAHKDIPVIHLFLYCQIVRKGSSRGQIQV